MKFYLVVLLYIIGIYSCTSGKKEKNNGDTKDIHIAANNLIDSLDITVNPDTATLAKKIDTSQKKVLLIFTGRAIPGKALLDKEFLENNEIFDELKKYSVYLLFVDERKNVNDSLIYDEGNMNYQRIHFNSVVHPHYITYSKGIKQCEEHGMGNKDSIIQFLYCQR